MVLGIMVCILIFRVYQVLNPSAETTGDKMFGRPGRTLPEGVEPKLPPVTPPDPAMEDWSRLWRKNPFIYTGPRRSGAGTQDAGQDEDVDLTLVQLRDKGNGTWLAKIKTSSRTDWYEAGESFEQFNLQEIDPETQCVTIFSEQRQGMLTKCIEDGN